MLPVSRAIRCLGVAAVLLYGTIMQPTPDSVSWQLVVWATVSALPFAISLVFFKQIALYLALLLSMIMVGLLSAALAGNDPIQLTRDVIGILFWIFGPLLVFLITSRPRTGNPVLSLEQMRLLLAVAGAALSVRYLLQQGESLAVALQANLRVNLEYLSSEPLVTYAFLYSAVAMFKTKSSFGSTGFALLFMLSSLGLIAANFRGPLLLGAAVLVSSSIVFSIEKFRSSPLRVLTTAAGAIVGVYLLQTEITQVVTKIATKFEAVGSNSKLEEFVSVFSSGTGIWQILMGEGMGGKSFIEGAGTTTGYTHNVLSYAYMKTGYIGVVLTVAAFTVALAELAFRRRELRHYAPEIITILYIGIFQAAYKHFGYGLLLGVCIVASEHIKGQLRNRRRTVDCGRFALKPRAEDSP